MRDAPPGNWPHHPSCVFAWNAAPRLNCSAGLQLLMRSGHRVKAEDCDPPVAAFEGQPHASAGLTNCCTNAKPGRQDAENLTIRQSQMCKDSSGVGLGERVELKSPAAPALSG